MSSQIPVQLLFFYGIFLISCGIIAVIFIGLKAKTALVSGGTSGCISILIAYLVSKDITGAQVAGILLAFALFVVFSWRVTKTFYALLDMIPSSHPDLKGKSIAFLIIGLMAIVSIVICGAQVILFTLS